MQWPPRMTSKQAADYMGVSDSWMRKSRVDGTGPAFIRIGTAVRYDRATLDRWMEARQATNTLRIEK